MGYIVNGHFILIADSLDDLPEIFDSLESSVNALNTDVDEENLTISFDIHEEV